ncbi:MAG: glucose-6-phosphate isomerase [Planctomycetes bacterium]|nr:glucose-6-phosphate isomerase [Planctomycetota bacterium]
MKLNYSGMLEEMIGEHGVQLEELNALMGQLDRARNELMERHGKGDLEWMGLPNTEEYVEQAEEVWNGCREGVENLVVLGIGGSALGNTALQTALRPPFWNMLPDGKRTGARLFVMDNVDPERLETLLGIVDAEKTVFNVITKSGSTAETAAQFLCVLGKVKEKLGEDWKKRFIFTTDPAKGAMRKLVQDCGLMSLPVPAGVGGRFSVLSPVGLLSTVATGADARALLKGAREMYMHFRSSTAERNVPLLLSGLLYLADTTRGQKIHVMMPYSDRLRDMADWFRQIWAESLGKAVDRNGKKLNSGPTPVKALGTTDQHSQVQLYIEGPFDKVVIMVEVEEESSGLAMGSQLIDSTAFTYLEGRRLAELFKAELIGTKVALTNAGRPNMTLTLPRVDEEAAGEFMFAWELATAVAGELYCIDAFDQPGVEGGKVAAYALMGREGFEDARERIAQLEKKLEGFVAP